MHPSLKLASAIALAALAASPALAQDKVKLTAVAVATQVDFQQKVADLCAANDGTYTVEVRSGGASYTDVVQQILQDSLLGRGPDVALTGNFTVRPLAERELAQPLDEVIAADPDWKKLGYDERMLEIARFNGHTYGIPFGVATPVLYYNMDLAKAAGYTDETLPKTWEDVIAFARKVHATDSTKIGIWMRYLVDTWYWQSLIYSRGGSMLTADEKAVAFADANGEWAIKLLSEMGKDTGFTDFNNQQSTEAFASGQIGVIAQSSSIIEPFYTKFGIKFDMRVMPFPGLTDKSKLPAGGGTGVLLTKDAARAAAAWSYLKCTVSIPAQKIVTESQGHSPANALAIEAADGLKDYYAGNPNRKVSLEQLPYITGWYAFPGENGLRIEKSILDNLQAVIVEGADPTATLAEMKADAEALLK